MNRKITRRNFLRLSAVTAAGTLVTACATPTPAPAPTSAPAPTTAPPPTVAAATAVPQPTAAAATAVPQPTTAATTVPAVSKYSEAPMLAELVKAGKLPPVEERLPKNPMVMTGYEGNGNYGGLWRRAFQGVSDINGPTKVVDRSWACMCC